MPTFLQDIRHTFRQLSRSPGFAAVAILTLGLGIGANTAIFSAVNGLLLRAPAHVQGFDRLVSIFTSDFSGPPYGSSSYPDVEDFAAGGPAFAGVAAYTIAPVVMGEAATAAQAELVLGQMVTANFFDVLRVPLAAGRAFAPGEDAAGAGDVVVLGYAFWQKRFGGDPAVVGSAVRLAGREFNVTGIAPDGFTGLIPGVVPAFYLPMGAADVLGFVDTRSRGSRGLFVVARLQDTSTIEQAIDQMTRTATSLHDQYPGVWTDVRDEPRRVSVLPAAQAIVPPQIRGPVAGFVAVMMAVVGAVLLIGCANIANLLLARATSRQREIGVRLALGAGRGRLIRQLLTESMVLAVIGGALGVGLAFVGTRALATVNLPLPVEIRLNVTPDLAVLGFAGLVAVVAGLLFGLAPALLATRRSLVASLKLDSASPAVSGRRLGLRGILAGGQIAVAVVLLVAAGLLVRSLQSAQSIDPGFRTSGLLFASLAQDDNANQTDQVMLFHRALRDRITALPGVREASYTQGLPLAVGGSRRSFSIEDYGPGEFEDMELNSTLVGPAYFEAMGVRMLRGRGFLESDGPGNQGVAVVNESFVRRYLNGNDPIGKRIGMGSDGALDIEIVGMVADGKYRSLAEEPLPFIWLSADQSPAGFTTIVVHADGRLAPIGESVRALVQELDPDVAVTNVSTVQQHLAFALLPQRIGAWLLGLFGALGLGLAALGIYGVMAYAVSRRTREMGIRLALGARPADVVRMVVRQGMRVAAIGAAIGLLAAFGIARLIEFLLFNVKPLDLTTFVGVILVVLAVSLLANWLPARRTAAVDPLSALRSE